uniref:Uncharacterized protein n=1 Tax=Globodera rostochiensis TaxID=31243 RepID=A0A914H6Q4_GLORO
MHPKAVIVLLLVLALCHCCVGGPKPNKGKGKASEANSSKRKAEAPSSTGCCFSFPPEATDAYNRVEMNMKQQPGDTHKLPTNNESGYKGGWEVKRKLILPTILDPNFKLQFFDKNMRDLYTRWLVEELSDGVETMNVVPTNIDSEVQTITSNSTGVVSNILDEFVQDNPFESADNAVTQLESMKQQPVDNDNLNTRNSLGYMGMPAHTQKNEAAATGRRIDYKIIQQVIGINPKVL